jgi:DNA-binding NtrC family response regulator
MPSASVNAAVVHPVMPASRAEVVQVEVDAGRMLLGRSPAMRRLWDQIQRIAPADVSVLITGETGTGKELVARILHRLSARARHELVALDCNAVAPGTIESELFGHERGAFTGADAQRAGVFEQADGATLFLDEIGNLPLDAQAKLLRVLQEREFRRLGGARLVRSDFRLITATNVDLGASVRRGTFRDDLFHRLKVVQLHLRPLRERREDIALLVSHFITHKRQRLRRSVCRVTHPALDQLCSYDWPGNVRELENVVATAMLECDGESIEPIHLHFEGGAAPAGLPPQDLDATFREARQHAMESFERLYLLGQLRRFRGRIMDVAHHAGVTTKHVRELMRRHGIDRRDFRPPLRRSSVRRPPPGR